MSKKEKKATQSPNVPDAYQRISDAVYRESKRVINYLKKRPTKRELKFIELLEENDVKFTHMKVFYKNMQNYRDLKEKYYIAQFWLHNKKLFIEIVTPRMLPSNSINYRTYDALEVFPKAQCIKISEESFDDIEFMSTLLSIIK